MGITNSKKTPRSSTIGQWLGVISIIAAFTLAVAISTGTKPSASETISIPKGCYAIPAHNPFGTDISDDVSIACNHGYRVTIENDGATIRITPPATAQ